MDARWVREGSGQGGGGESREVGKSVEDVSRVVSGQVEQSRGLDGEAGVQFRSLSHTPYHRLQQRKDRRAK